jgi:hypothetical protein
MRQLGHNRATTLEPSSLNPVAGRSEEFRKRSIFFRYIEKGKADCGVFLECDHFGPIVPGLGPRNETRTPWVNAT